jgi:hypothetical protein
MHAEGSGIQDLFLFHQIPAAAEEQVDNLVVG